jgi:putative glutamine amidotransferase
MKKRLFLILTLSIILSPLIAYAKPILLITNPYKAIIENILYLQDNKIMVKTDFLFLLHEQETKIIKNLKKMMKKNRGHNYKIVTLKGIPYSDEFQKMASSDKKRFPNYDVKRFKTNRNQKTPESWLKSFQKIFKESDGYIIPGGRDIPAEVYGDKQFIETYGGSALRSTYEIAYIRFLLSKKSDMMKNKPNYFVMGICLGCQMLNSATGGALYQSIPLELYGKYYVEDLLKLGPDYMHKNYYNSIYYPVKQLYSGWFHRVKFNNLISKYFLTLKDVYVLSNHHQAIKKNGYNFEITGTSIDGKVPELFRNKKYSNVIAVQFHPEKKFCFDRLNDYNENSVKFHKHLWKTISNTLRVNEQLRK